MNSSNDSEMAGEFIQEILFVRISILISFWKAKIEYFAMDVV
jgi:hypothetical protein